MEVFFCETLKTKKKKKTLQNFHSGSWANVFWMFDKDVKSISFGFVFAQWEQKKNMSVCDELAGLISGLSAANYAA